MIQCDVAVIGAGPGGYVAAIRAAQLGAKVVVIEREELGGVCLNWGCIPTKTLIYTAELYRKLKDGAKYGIEVDGLSLNMKALLKRKNDVVRRNKSGITALFKAHDIQVVQGDAKITAPGVVTVGAEEVRAKSTIIASGSKPTTVPGIALNGKTIITCREALDLDAVPKRVAVIGAGAVGAEFACIWNAFGAEVTVVEMLPSVLPREDEEITAKLAATMTKKGIDVRTSTKVASVAESNGAVHLELEGAKAGGIDVDLVLVAIGFAFNSEALIDSPGLNIARTERGWIQVNDRMQTSVPGIYAIGDVVGKALLAHAASAQGLVAAENATGGNRRMDYRVVPACTFTSPEVASVGLTEKAARDAGINVKVGRFAFVASGRAQSMGETEGMVKIVGDAVTDEVVGVHIMGAEASELIAAAAMAMSLESTVEEIARTIHTHPTLAETILEAAEDYLGHGIHTPPKK